MPAFSRLLALCLVPGLGLVLLNPAVSDDKPSAPELQNSQPLAPREAHKSFQIVKGFRSELVASEPDVIDPVAMAFDERGRIFVCEMRGYPNGGIGKGDITSGQIRLLEDRDRDGFYETARVFAQGLRLPMSVLPWKKGVLVAVAPDLVYLEDADDDGKAEKKHVLYTGFDLANIQQMVSSLTLGLDGWVHGIAGSSGGTVTSVEKPDLPAVSLRNRGFRFRPDVPGSLEPTSGGGQYGLTSDPWGRWFTATNSQHLRHIVLPDHALRRNPSLPVRATTLDIAEHGAACKVFRVSPFEKWRVERTRRRKDGPDSSRFASTELVPGGFVTSGCSPLYYDADLFPKEYRGSVFVCDPANNLVLRDVLSENGATFTARRGHADCEFLASTDNWFRPVWLSLGPDGAIYALDFYREVIETPLSLPEDIKKRLNLESRARGRIWRIAPEGTPPFKEKPALQNASSETLVKLLAHENAWWRTTAQRLLQQRRDRGTIQPLEQLAQGSTSARARAHALWLLEDQGSLSETVLEKALSDGEPGVCEQALRLAEIRLQKTPALLKVLKPLTSHPSPRVRFQLAITLGGTDSLERLPLLATLLARRDTDTWTRTAILASTGRQSSEMLVGMLQKTRQAGPPQEKDRPVLIALASLAGTTGTEAELRQILGQLEPGTAADWQLGVLEALADGMSQSARSLLALPGMSGRVMAYLTQARAVARNEKASIADRGTAIRLLAHGKFDQVKDVFAEMLAPQQPPEIQLAAIRALAPLPSAGTTELLLQRWANYSPSVRRECAEALFTRPERILALLTAIEKKQVLVNQVEPARLALLKKHREAEVRRRAEQVLAGSVAPARQKVLEGYRAALELKGERERGKAVFKKTCATCHRLEDVGHQVGADLLAALKNKTAEQLLLDILDPSREVDPRFQNYLVTTTKGRSVTGLLATETASSVTLRRGEGAEDVLLRSQIEEIMATGQSLMPDNLETQLSKQDVADLIEYLLRVGNPSGK